MARNDYELKAARALDVAAPTIYDIQKLLHDAIAAATDDWGPLIDVDLSECTYQWSEVHYSNTEPSWNADSLYTIGVDNASPGEVSVSLKRSESTTATFTWSLTEGIKVGVKTDVEVGIPKIADGKIEVSAEMNLSSTQASTTSKTQVWEVDAAITVPAWTHVDASMILKQGVQDAAFEIDVTCGGHATAYVNSGGQTVIVDVSQAVLLHDYANVPSKRYTPPADDDSDDDGEFVIALRGLFKGVQGVGVTILQKGHPIAHVNDVEQLRAHLRKVK